MSGKNDFSNFGIIRRTDEIKFVICDRADYEWSREVVRDHRLSEQCAVLFSPAYGAVAPGDLAAWILRDGLEVRLNLQLHKYIYGPDERMV
jgi:7-carboxy-7-deazaguanine synthase